jgi:hypothetical protein
MILQEPTETTLAEWRAIHAQYRGKLTPNRKSGAELLQYLAEKYVLTEIDDTAAAEVVAENVTRNACRAEKLPEGATPVPCTFFVENTGEGKRLYRDENKDPAGVWGGEVTRIFVGIDSVTGFFMVEGSSLLWDELSAFRGLDERDLENFVCVAEYIHSLERFGLLPAVWTV